MRVLTLGLGAALLAAGCGGSGTSPSTPTPVRVTVQATPTFAAEPDTARFTASVENISRAVVDLTFPDSCQVLPYFVNRQTGRVVTPVGGGFGCATVITTQTLQAGEGFTEAFTVKAGTAPRPDAIVLPPGDYAVYARLEDSTHRVRSDQLAFSVR
jgi:Intracellular proteinase inhibitor